MKKKNTKTFIDATVGEFAINQANNKSKTFTGL